MTRSNLPSELIMSSFSSESISSTGLTGGPKQEKAASALTGRITDPRTLGEEPEVEYPDKYKYKSEWFMYPPKDASSVRIVVCRNRQRETDVPFATA